MRGADAACDAQGIQCLADDGFQAMSQARATWGDEEASSPALRSAFSVADPHMQQITHRTDQVFKICVILYFRIAQALLLAMRSESLVTCANSLRARHARNATPF